MQTEVNNLVDECRDQGLITSHHCKEDRPHYLEWEKFLRDFFGRTTEGRLCI